MHCVHLYSLCVVQCVFVHVLTTMIVSNTVNGTACRHFTTESSTASRLASPGM